MYSQSRIHESLERVLVCTRQGIVEPATLTRVDDEEVPLLPLVYLPDTCEQHPRDGVLRTTSALRC